MSVGHVARALEDAGTPTVIVMVRSFRHVAERMALPRVVITRHPMGRPFGAPGDVDRQTEVLDAALTLLDTAIEGPSLVELEQPYRPGPSG